MFKSYARKGFTLIELLVVISIISLLSSVVLASLNSARAKARDTQRVSDLHQFQTALEFYYDAHNGQYPAFCGAASSGAYAANWPNLAAVLQPYISRMSNDPKNVAAEYGYYYCSGYVPNGKCGYTYTALNNNYIFAMRLENPSSSSNSCATTFGGWDNASLNYIVGGSQ